MGIILQLVAFSVEHVSPFGSRSQIQCPFPVSQAHYQNLVNYIVGIGLVSRLVKVDKVIIVSQEILTVILGRAGPENRLVAEDDVRKWSDQGIFDQMGDQLAFVYQSQNGVINNLGLVAGDGDVGGLILPTAAT